MKFVGAAFLLVGVTGIFISLDIGNVISSSLGNGFAKGLRKFLFIYVLMCVFGIVYLTGLLE